MNGDAKQPDEPANWQYKPSDVDPQPANQPAPPAYPAPAPPTNDAVQAQPASVPVPQAASVAPLPERHAEVSWVAEEFIAHEKSLLWYLALIIITLGLALMVLLLSHDKVSTTLIVIIGIIFGAAAGRQPRSLQYLLDDKGITINRAFRPYGDFKSFAVVEEGEINTIIFMPLKRFTLPLSLNVGENETDEVVAKLSDYMPNDQTHGHDAIDRFVQRIHF
jgi:hypothetical protein